MYAAALKLLVLIRAWFDSSNLLYQGLAHSTIRRITMIMVVAMMIEGILTLSVQSQVAKLKPGILCAVRALSCAHAAFLRL